MSGVLHRCFSAALLLLSALLFANGQQVPAGEHMQGYGAASRRLLDSIPCTADLQCDDGLACTKDRCLAGYCDHSLLTCATDLKCQRAACVTAPGATDVCGIIPKCTTDNKCKVAKCLPDGTCAPLTARVCPPFAPANQCLSLIGCDALAGCKYGLRTCPVNDNKCLINPVCNAATGCTYTPKECPLPANKCNKSICVPATGLCVEEPIVCAANADKCAFTATCDVKKGCVVTPRPPVTCPPSTNLCLKNVCNPISGKCGTVPAIVCNGLGPCFTGSCVALDGTCTYKPKCPTGVDPKKPCFVQLCQKKTGVCYKKKKNCSDKDKCTDDTCNPLNGKCIHTDNKTCKCCKGKKCPPNTKKC